jgi:hypothetical protein
VKGFQPVMAAVDVDRDWVEVGGGTFIKNGGVISQNNSLSGGGVYVDEGAFKKNGGEISNNTGGRDPL